VVRMRKKNGIGVNRRHAGARRYGSFFTNPSIPSEVIVAGTAPSCRLPERFAPSPRAGLCPESSLFWTRRMERSGKIYTKSPPRSASER
jgi:hypothetical protein